MVIQEIMRQGAITVDMDDSMEKVRELFDKNRFHHLLVTENGRLKGVISDRDLLSHLSPFIGKLSERPQDVATLNRRAHQIMSHHPITASAETPVEEAVKLMLQGKNISCLPVIDTDRNILGIVTWRDMLRGISNPQEAVLFATCEPDPLPIPV